MGLILACDAELIPFWQCPSWNFSWELSMVLQAQSDQFRAERFAVLKWSPGTHWPHGQLNLLLTCIGFVNNGNFKFKLNSYYFPRLIMPLGQLRFGKGLPHFEVKCYSAAPTLIDRSPYKDKLTPGRAVKRPHPTNSPSETAATTQSPFAQGHAFLG